MLADVVFDALRPFHLWAQVAAVCALVLGAAAYVVLLRSRRWWPGMGIFATCLLVVAFGERSRGAAGDLRPIADACYNPPPIPGCETWTSWLTRAQQIVTVLGVLTLVATVLGVIAAIVVLFASRNDAGWRFALGRNLGIALGIAAWFRYADLADITRAGDALGQIPLVQAIFGTILGIVVLVIGLAVVVACIRPARERPANIAPGLAEG